jgi:hypothetical protein
MSEAFTITAENINNIDKFEELRLAFAERYYACTGKHIKYVWAEDTSNPGTYKYQWVDGLAQDASALGEGEPNPDALQQNIPSTPADDPESPPVETMINMQTTAFYRKIQEFIMWGGRDEPGVTYDEDYEEISFFAKTYDSGSPFAEDESPLFYTPIEFFKYVGGNLYTEDAGGTLTHCGFRRASVDETTGDPVFNEETGELVMEENVVYKKETPFGNYGAIKYSWAFDGFARDGDIFGDWLIDDLLKCLSAIKSTRVFHTENSNGKVDGLWTNGCHVDVPLWYSRITLGGHAVVDYQEAINLASCASMSEEEYEDHIAEGTLPPGTWIFREAPYLDRITDSWTDGNEYFNIETATQVIGYPLPYYALVREAMEVPPGEPVTHEGVDYYMFDPFYLNTVLTTSPDSVTEENGSGYPAVYPRNTYSVFIPDCEIIKWAQYNVQVSSLNAPETINVDVYREVFEFPSTFERIERRPPERVATVNLGSSIIIDEGEYQTETVPLFIVNWDFTNA